MAKTTKQDRPAEADYQAHADLPTPTEEARKRPVVELRAGYDLALLRQAAEHRADVLEKLAKKIGDEGYDAKAREVLLDAAALKVDILPKLAPAQLEAPLEDPADWLFNALRTVVKARTGELRMKLDAIERNNDGTETARERAKSAAADAWTETERKIAEDVADRLESVAAHAFEEGRRVRELTPAELAVRGLEAAAREKAKSSV